MSSILNEPYRNQLQTTLNYSTSTATPTATDQSTINSANSGYSPSIHGIVIATPTNTHAPLIEEAASKNISIFTEKPVDDTSDKISHLFSIADAHGVDLCCGFQRRFDASYISTQQTLAEGHIGKPIMAHVTFADHPRPSMEFMKLGGCIYSDLSPHDVDYIRWCLGDDVESVYATGTSSVKELEDAGVHDNATMLLRFKRGTIVTISLSRASTYGYDQRCEIFGDKGLTRIDNVYANTNVLSTSDGISRPKLQHSFPQRFEKAFAAELDAYADTLLEGKEWPISRDDCIAVQKVSDAARLSAELGRAVMIDEL
mmetsp:Transcript_49027/g.59346  ORF Transcript_49027/g.59346 Transcript_49027/m.59346 type:complete len:314 (+) Transcript_49027:453-1394(+)